MPDSDRVPRVPRRHWRRPCAAMVGGQDPAFVGHEIDRAITATLREHPLSSPHELAHEMLEAAQLRDDARFQKALARYGQAEGIGPLTSQVMAQASAMMELGSNGLVDCSESEVMAALVVGALRRFAEASLCGADDVMKAMLEEGVNFAQVRERQRACLDAAQIEASAVQILSGNGARPRTPPIQIAKLSTAELLDQRL